MVKTLAQKLIPILPLRYVMNHRPKNHVIVRVPAMLEEQNLSFRLQDSSSLAEQFLASAACRKLVRAKAKAHRVARRVRQRNAEMIGPKSLNPRIGLRRHFQIANVRNRLLGRLAFSI